MYSSRDRIAYGTFDQRDAGPARVYQCSRLARVSSLVQPSFYAYLPFMQICCVRFVHLTRVKETSEVLKRTLCIVRSDQKLPKII